MNVDNFWLSLTCFFFFFHSLLFSYTLVCPSFFFHFSFFSFLFYSLVYFDVSFINSVFHSIRFFFLDLFSSFFFLSFVRSFIFFLLIWFSYLSFFPFFFQSLSFPFDFSLSIFALFLSFFISFPFACDFHSIFFLIFFLDSLCSISITLIRFFHSFLLDIVLDAILNDTKNWHAYRHIHSCNFYDIFPFLLFKRSAFPFNCFYSMLMLLSQGHLRLTSVLMRSRFSYAYLLNKRCVFAEKISIQNTGFERVKILISTNRTSW